MSKEQIVNKKSSDIEEYKNIKTIIGWSISIVVVFWLINMVSLGFMDSNERGTLGDMFGAVNAVFSGLAFAGIIISLYMQRIDLKNQKEQLELNYEEVKQTNREFKIQNQTLQIQKFENQYYKMIDLHRGNVGEFSIPFFDLLGDSPTSTINISIEKKSPNIILREVTGKKGFVDMAKELKYCFECSLNILMEENNFGYQKEDVLSFAYSIFFWGVYSDFADSKMIEIEHQNIVKNTLKLEQDDYKSNLYQGGSQKIKTRYVPFQGHESRLAHYYRHLFQTVKYVTFQVDNSVISYKEARQYLRVLRAQLSNSEQLMLYYNYICGFGSNWDRLGTKSYGFFTRYRMIHNLPIDRVKYVEHPYNHFKTYRNSDECVDDNMFEWED
ncbi:putative phage abortive infection protein [Dokdonia sp. Asnod2-E02]|uniref:putative phage abortive infection protein n=1 Tax=Dokdonia sp. Asnod2-E02 TaxID=3160574 RepID=UPI00386E75C6